MSKENLNSECNSSRANLLVRKLLVKWERKRKNLLKSIDKEENKCSLKDSEHLVHLRALRIMLDDCLWDLQKDIII